MSEIAGKTKMKYGVIANTEHIDYTKPVKHQIT